jgi:hypothetical protein
MCAGDAAPEAVKSADSSVSDAKVGGLRAMLGKAVRTQAGQQQEIDLLRSLLREEVTKAETARHAAGVAEAEATGLREKVQELQKQLSDEQRERMESEAAALEREESLEVGHRCPPLAKSPPRPVPCRARAHTRLRVGSYLSWTHGCPSTRCLSAGES